MEVPLATGSDLSRSRQSALGLMRSLRLCSGPLRRSGQTACQTVGTVRPRPLPLRPQPEDQRRPSGTVRCTGADPVRLVVSPCGGIVSSHRTPAHVREG